MRTFEPKATTLPEFAAELLLLICNDDGGFPFQVNNPRGQGWMRFFCQADISGFLHGLDFAADMVDSAAYTRALDLEIEKRKR